MHTISKPEQQLCEYLKTQPSKYKNRYTDNAANDLLQSLFWSLAGGNQEYLKLFFPENTRPSNPMPWKLRKAQSNVDGDEFTEAARGKACGHIFKPGEVTYRCKTCSVDETCVLCSRCYDSSEHTGHMVYVSLSLGNSGSCDCGDPEAWKRPVYCSIHTDFGHGLGNKGKEKEPILPDDLVESIRMTIGRVYDYICDVISCSPEQLRLPKSRETILLDEKMSRLSSQYYDGDIAEDPCEFAVLLWNDEKHTVNEVRDQVARACKVTMAEGLQRAHETDDMGRSIIKYSTDVTELLKVSKVIEQIKVTVTIRSARDTFREQMCGTIIEWLGDIAGCSVGTDHNVLRRTVCEEMLKPWSAGSEASNADVGMKGIHDHEKEEREYDDYRTLLLDRTAEIRRQVLLAAEGDNSDDGDDNEPDMEIGEFDDEEGAMSTDDEGGQGELEEEALTFRPENFLGPEPEAEAVVTIPATYRAPPTADTEGDIDMTGEDDAALEVQEATLAGYPPPPPPPPAPPRPQARDRDLTPSDSDTTEMQPLISHSVYAKANLEIPKTPRGTLPDKALPKPARYWLDVPETYNDEAPLQLYENLQERLRLDWMILFDLRMWKQVRVHLRDLYISTVVTLPEFKRVLGLRFAGLYTTLAELYLIADREPDHSIINISVQMLTTPTITSEIVDRGNFLTNLMAILYTFLTTRQVGHPHEIYPNATLAFDSGSVTNRRMYHFFMDLRYLFGSEHVQARLRTEERYMLQFLDLVKLHQGICPNLRAVGEHVEYETDAWISASLITREVNRLCRQFAESFKMKPGDDPSHISNAIRLAAKAVILSSLGTERKRFTHAEVKEEIKFKKVGDYEFDTTEMSNSVLQHSVVKFVVESQPISFHHALHYTLSWLIESGKSMSREHLISLLTFTTQDLSQKAKAMGQRNLPSQEYTPEDHLMAAFDYPLRVCAWLAQMKTSMWVRNGMSLRHQSGTYRGVNQRDVSHHRDIFLLQTAMVVCSPARVLVSMIDRYGLEHWMKGLYESRSDGVDVTQMLDITEDMIHLLIVLISERTSLVSHEESEPHVLAMRRDIAHVLCFKPLSFSEICSKLPDKFHDQEECQDILDEMTIYKAPEGLTDNGTFELKEKFLEDIDPYIAHYNKNQREESENAYKAWISKKTGRPLAEVVFEPKLRQIESGAFSNLSAFTRTGIFAQIIYYALLYPLKAEELTPTVAVTRVETFLQVVLHLVLIAISEDRTEEDEMSEESLHSFVYIALTSTARSNFLPNSPASRTIAAVLDLLSQKESLKACHPKIALVLKRMRQKRPRNFVIAFTKLGLSVDRINTASPANNNVLEDREKKKQAALERQAKVMAQFQQQQKNFLDNQGDIDWGEDEMSDDTMDESGEDHKAYWQFPSGTCTLCREETKDGRLYGTFGLLAKSSILRQTPFEDPAFVREVLKTPVSLDRSADDIRPFGVSGENREQVHKVTSDGREIVAERQFVGKGFPSSSSLPGPVSTGCGHIMHYKCFEEYYAASNRRHQHQIARHHPEDLSANEFVCPLCKALGNTFLPIIWGPKEEVYPGLLQTASDFDKWLAYYSASPQSHSESWVRNHPIDAKVSGGSRIMGLFTRNNSQAIAGPLHAKMSELLLDAWDSTAPTSLRPTRPRMPNDDASHPAWADGADHVASPVGGNLRASQNPSAVSPMNELVEIYRRLRDTMAKNELPEGPPSSPQHHENDLCHSDTLAETLGISISSVEIQQRGVESQSGLTLLDTIPQQSITHLRVLAATASSYISIGGIKLAGDNRVAKEFCQDYESQYHQLFGRGPYPVDDPFYNRRSWTPLFDQDTFVFLTKCTLCLAQVEELEIMHLVRLCYFAEIVKVIMRLGPMMDGSDWEDAVGTPVSNTDDVQDLANIISFCEVIWGLDRSLDTGDVELRMMTAYRCGFSRIRNFVQAYATVFLRKVVVLLHVKYGIVSNNHISSFPDSCEVDRLTEALRLPSFNSMMSAGLGEERSLLNVVECWMAAHSEFYPMPPTDQGGALASETLTLTHPTIFELVGLPINFDTLMEETMKSRCPTTGKNVSDPMLCLFCGEIFCGQSVCCLKEGPEDPDGRPKEVGGAQQHMLNKCQKNMGLYINIRKCCIFYQHRQSGTWMLAPYVDKYGEPDPGLRHSRQLFLHKKRYDALVRAAWLSHGVPSIISRKLEMDINNGGWETV